MDRVNEIRDYIFANGLQLTRNIEDEEFTTHAMFLQQTETYKTLKQAIRLGDIGLIERSIKRYSLLFHGSSQPKYAFLSLYMTWLTRSGAADSELRKAVLADSLVNLRGASDSHFEMDRLNEMLNLEFRSLVALRRTSTTQINDLFHRAAMGG